MGTPIDWLACSRPGDVGNTFSLVKAKLTGGMKRRFVVGSAFVRPPQNEANVYYLVLIIHEGHNSRSFWYGLTIPVGNEIFHDKDFRATSRRCWIGGGVCLSAGR